MTERKFWTLLEKSNSPTNRLWAGIQKWVLRREIDEDESRESRLESALSRLSSTELKQFDEIYFATMKQANTQQIRDCCYLIDGTISEAGLNDFLAWLVSLGENSFRRALAKPAFLATQVRQRWEYINDFVDLFECADNVHEEKFNEAIDGHDERRIEFDEPSLVVRDLENKHPEVASSATCLWLEPYANYKAEKTSSFQYSGSFNGRHESGSVEAATESAALAQLASSGITNIRINGRAVSESEFKAAEGSEVKKIPSLLQDAALAGRLRIIEVLLANGVNINGKNVSGESALYQAVAGKNSDIALHLIERGADINIRGPYAITPLILAIRLGVADVAIELIKRGADIHAKTTAGDTALSVSCQHTV